MLKKISTTLLMMIPLCFLMIFQNPASNSSHSFMILKLEDQSIIYLPKYLNRENTNTSEILLLNSIDHHLAFFAQKYPSNSISSAMKEILKLLSQADFLAKDGFYLLYQNETILRSSLNEVGCLEDQLSHCLEISNHYYRSKEILFDLILLQSMSPQQLRNQILKLFNSQKIESNSSQNSTSSFLYYRIRMQITENEMGEIYLTGIITPKKYYFQNEYRIRKILAPSNIVKEKQLREYREDLITTAIPEPIYFLFVIDNSNSMLEEQHAIKKNISNFLKKLQEFSRNFSVGVITTDNCQVSSFTRDLKKLEKEILVGTSGNDIESCTYFAEKFLTDSSCNHGWTPNNLSIICITDESDAYFLLSKKTFDERDNIFTHRKIPFYSILPLNQKGELGDCTGDYGITAFTDNFGNYEKTIQKSIHLPLLAKETGASVFPICNYEYKTFLEEIALSTIAKYSRFPLSKIPIPISIRVWLNEKEIFYPETSRNSISFIYSSTTNSILLKGKIPERKIHLKVKYLTFDN